MASNLANCPFPVKAKWPIDRRGKSVFIQPMDQATDFRETMLAEIARTGMSLAELARRSQVSYDVLNKLKRREGSSTSAENARAIAAALNLPWQQDDDPPPVGRHSADDLVNVYNVAASAGHGALVGDDEEIIDRLSFPPGYLRKITSANPKNLAIIGVKGESMSPTLADNDVVMIDTSKRDLSFDGLFVLRDGGASLLVKRIGRGSRRGCITLISDNRSYPTTERAIEDIEVIGKVVWMGVKV
jgi:phage repressor protein C with HTH and peptisase S24 domain